MSTSCTHFFFFFDECGNKAHAYLEKSAFTAWHFNPPAVANSQRQRAQDSDEEDGHSKHSEEEEEDSMAEVRFEVSMSSLIECLNVFGTASSQKTYTKHFVDHDSTADHSSGHPPKRKYGEDSNRSKGWPSKSRKLPTSAVRISYDGEGHPLVLLYVSFRIHLYLDETWLVVWYFNNSIGS